MSTFRIGQRVKKARPLRVSLGRGSSAVPVGTTGVIRELGYFDVGTKTKSGHLTHPADAVVDYDGFGPRTTLQEVLEPIIPEGHRASDYSFTELMDRCRAGEVEA